MYLSIYDQYFSSNASKTDWDQFRSKEDDFTLPLSQRTADFSIEPRSWQDTARDVALFFAKVVFFPWGLYSMAKYLTARLIMTFLYPAQSNLIKLFSLFPIMAGELGEMRKELASQVKEEFIIRDVVLEKKGIRYSGLLVSHRDHIQNGCWTLQATGNMEPVEHTALSYARTYASAGFNTLLINGPGVGKSEGLATPETIGDAQEVGISFLETALKANQIALAGRSLGGAAIGQAILKHTFKPDIEYRVIQQMTFDSVSNICGEHAGGLVRRLVRWSGCEMDTVSASRKLMEMGIPETIIQASHRHYEVPVPREEDFIKDGPILPRASLGYRLVKENILENKTFRCLPHADHNTSEAIDEAAAAMAAMSQSEVAV